MEEEQKEGADEIERKEDTAEYQNSEEIGKEDVIEDEGKSVEGGESEIMRQIGEVREMMQQFNSRLISINDTVTQFIDAGAVIREYDGGTETDGGEFRPQRLEEMDFSI